MTTASDWRCGELDLDVHRCRIMGIVNATPDSFSDGGLHFGERAAIDWGMQLLEDGADIIDVGGESTRPGFDEVGVAEELSRVVPVVEALANVGAMVSVDTRHPQVAQAALDAGACIINDVSGFEDPAMAGIASSSSCGLVIMHSSPAHFGAGRDVSNGSIRTVSQIFSSLSSRARALESAGVEPRRICLDPGTGFNGSHELDLEALQRFSELAHLGYPCMCAVSRKRVAGLVSGVRESSERDAVSMGIALAAVSAGARIVRVHDVRRMRQALDGFEACHGNSPRRRAIVALGANLGDRLAELEWALGQIDALPLTEVVSWSRAYETEPAYLEDQPRFANSVALVETRLHPRALLDALLQIEDRAGRVRIVANGSRCLDLDLAWMEGERSSSSRLRLPHPRMGERDFVLTPLADVLGSPEEVERFCKDQHIPLAARGERLGAVVGCLGELRIQKGVSG